MRELGGYLGQTSLLRKDFKIRGIISNSGQKDRISFVGGKGGGGGVEGNAT